MPTTSDSTRRRHTPPEHELTIDTRSLGRTPGATMAVERTVITPERIGVELIWLPEHTEFDLNLIFTCVEEGVLVTGTVSGTATIECARCLGTQHLPTSVELTELYAFPNTAAAKGVDNDEVRLIEGEQVDLLPALIDAFGLEFPLAPTCELAGAPQCVESNTPAPDGVSGEESDRIDPRWAALAEKYGTNSDDNSSQDSDK